MMPTHPGDWPDLRYSIRDMSALEANPRRTYIVIQESENV
jgi:hypothetical protein